MSITDELRKWGYGFCGDTHDVVTAIADRIDAEHETTELQKESYRLDLKAANIAVGEAYKRGYDEGFASADDWLAQNANAMAEHGWVRLPKDADGETIHIGDVMEWCDSGETLTVEGIGIDVLFYIDGENAEWTAARNKRHHHAPTVEDVLRDACRAYHSLMVESMSDVAHDMPAPSEIIAEYAKRLRLADDEEDK